MTVATLFGGLHECPSWLLPVEINAESELMQVLAVVDEYKHPDNQVVEILSEGKYIE
jgi:hypothetical protein